MSSCQICGVDIPSDTQGKSLCSKCQNNKNINYFDLSIREPSIRYLDSLAMNRQGKNLEDTILRIQDILSRHPEKESELTTKSYIYKCPLCSLSFIRNVNIVIGYYENRLQYAPLCTRCDLYSRNHQTTSVHN